jgi:Uma2 family endonuclease
MTTLPSKAAPPPDVPELHTGDRMTRAEFHAAYERTSPHFKAELVGGIVYVVSPLKRPHATNTLPLGLLLQTYEMNTPGVEAADNATLLLGEESELQPDLFLRILPEYGGQSRTTPDDYVEGAPELVAEVAHSTRALALHAKRADYTRAGVREHLVLCLRERRLRWFDLREDRELAPDADGVVRIRCFPGLWIDVEAVLTKERRLTEVLGQGLASPEHAAFVQSLAEARSKALRGRRKKPSPRGRRRGRDASGSS